MNFQEKKTSALVSNLFQKAEIDIPDAVKQNWSQIDDIYMSSADGLVQVAEQINECVRLINRVGCSNMDEVIAMITGLKRDLETFTGELIGLRALHQGKTGVVEDPDDLAFCIQIYNQYVVFNDRFKSVVFPFVITITEAYSEALERLQEPEDEDGITDVEIIEKVKVQ